jgi:hypothetical protein
MKHLLKARKLALAVALGSGSGGYGGYRTSTGGC